MGPAMGTASVSSPAELICAMSYSLIDHSTGGTPGKQPAGRSAAVYWTVFGLGAIVVTVRSFAGDVLGVICRPVHVAVETGVPFRVTPLSAMVRPESVPASRPEGLSMKVLQAGSHGSFMHGIDG